MVEIEVKIIINDIDEVIGKVLDLGARLEKERHLELNTLYDFPSRSLFKLAISSTKSMKTDIEKISIPTPICDILDESPLF